MKELDTVRVVRLLQPIRHYDGTEAVKRAPRVDDTGVIVHVHKPGEAFAVAGLIPEVQCSSLEGEILFSRSRPSLSSTCCA